MPPGGEAGGGGKRADFLPDQNPQLYLAEAKYIESRGRKVDVHTVRDCVTVYATMSGLEEQLGGNFYKCHRGYLVNLAHVAEYEPDRILLGSGETVFMARDKYAEFVKVYMRFLKEEGIVHV